MVTVLAFVFRYALRLLLAWFIVSVVVSFLVGSIIRKMGGDD